jgi:hypothetical protein
MAIEQKFVDLINANIDGEIDRASKAELDAFLAQNDEARALQQELVALCASIESIESLPAPPHLRHVIMSSMSPIPLPPASPGILQALFGSPVLKYLSAFTAGVLLTLSIVSSDQIANEAFDDVTGLVGTIADPIRGNLVSQIAIDNANVAGQVSLRSSGSMLILDLDLVANSPIHIEVDYADRTIWFNGFAQLESKGASVSAKSGVVTLGLEGKRRYAVYFQNGGERNVTFNLSFVAGGAVFHDASLSYERAE